MKKTAELAQSHGFDCFGTTLTVSRHKNSKLLEKIGKEVALEVGVNYLAEDFKKKNGFQLSIQRSEQLSLRRQDYCGCAISRREARLRRIVGWKERL